MESGIVAINHQKYLAGDTWKCDKSPTGAHYWVGLPDTAEDGYCIFLCKHCFDARKLPITFDAALKETFKRPKVCCLGV